MLYEKKDTFDLLTQSICSSITQVCGWKVQIISTMLENAVKSCVTGTAKLLQAIHCEGYAGGKAGAKDRCAQKT